MDLVAPALLLCTGLQLVYGVAGLGSRVAGYVLGWAWEAGQFYTLQSVGLRYGVLALKSTSPKVPLALALGTALGGWHVVTMYKLNFAGMCLRGLGYLWLQRQGGGYLLEWTRILLTEGGRRLIAGSYSRPVLELKGLF